MILNQVGIFPFCFQYYNIIPEELRFKNCCICKQLFYILNLDFILFAFHDVCHDCRSYFNYWNDDNRYIKMYNINNEILIHPILYAFQHHNHECLISNHSNILLHFKSSPIYLIFFEIINNSCLICLNIFIRLFPPLSFFININLISNINDNYKTFYLIGKISINKYNYKELLIYDEFYNNKYFQNSNFYINSCYFIYVTKLMMLLKQKIHPNILITNNLPQLMIDYINIYEKSKNPLNLQQICKNKIWLYKKNEIGLNKYINNLKIYSSKIMIDFLIGQELLFTFKNIIYSKTCRFIKDKK
jgi:hypothetical protein